jgi:uncharacterized protein YndB with AHSA1/START domain
MPTITAEASRTIDAPPGKVYDILADYHHGHPRILPEQYFTDLVVEEGGRGEGTVIRFRMHVLGGTRTARAVVGEPVPGRVLTETYPENGAVTTFDVEPLEEGRRTRLTITTSWASAGVRGMLERWIMQPLLQKIFHAEMTKLEEYVRGGATAGVPG